MSHIPTITKHFIPSFELLALTGAALTVATVGACVLAITALCGLIFVLFTMLHFLFVLCNAVNVAYMQFDQFGHSSMLLIGLSCVFVWAYKMRFSTVKGA